MTNKKHTWMTVISLSTLTIAPASAALVLEFNEVGSDVVLSFSGSVDLSGSFVNDGAPLSLFKATLVPGGLGIDVAADGSTAFAIFDQFIGTDLLSSDLVSSSIIGDDQVGFTVSNDRLSYGVGLDTNVMEDSASNVTIVSAGVGGVLNSATQTFNTTYVASGLDAHATDTLIDMWRVTGTTGTDNLIQFRINTTLVPEPSNALLFALDSLSIIARRKQ